VARIRERYECIGDRRQIFALGGQFFGRTSGVKREREREGGRVPEQCKKTLVWHLRALGILKVEWWGKRDERVHRLKHFIVEDYEKRERARDCRH
jgi:hypothetical protein